MHRPVIRATMTQPLPCRGAHCRRATARTTPVGTPNARGVSINALIEAIDEGRTGNLSSAIRVFVLAEAMKMGTSKAG